MLNTLFQTDLILYSSYTTLLLGFSTVVLLLWHSSWKQTYWKKIGVPYVKPFPIIGSLYENLTVPQPQLEIERHEKYGRIYGLYEGNRAVLSVGEPKLLKDILVKDFSNFPQRKPIFPRVDNIISNLLLVINGEGWKRIRRIVTPTFTTGKIKRMMGIFRECSGTLMKNFGETVRKRENVDAKKVYGAYAMDVVASSAFSTKIDSHNDSNNQFVQSAIHLACRGFKWKFIMFALYPKLVEFLKLSSYSTNSVSFFTKVILQIIEERKKTGQTRNDFLQLLLDTANEPFHESKLDEEDNTTKNYGEDENDQVFKTTSVTNKTLSKDEIIGQCLTFFLAGYDTTTTSLSFVSYSLALNPDVQEKLIQELDEALIEHNGDLTYEGIQSLKYLDNVISETMRMYPPILRLTRIADEDYKLGDTGIIVPKGMVVSIPVYAIQKDPKNFPDPEKFDPDRFTPEARAKRDPFSFLPFGAGPKNCIGMRFALVEMKVCLAHVLRRFRFKRCPQTKVPLEFLPNLGLLQAKEIIIALEERTDFVKEL